MASSSGDAPGREGAGGPAGSPHTPPGAPVPAKLKKAQTFDAAAALAARREEAVRRRTSFDERRPALRDLEAGPLGDGGTGVPSSRVDRLLRQRQMRRSMSSQGLSQALWHSSEEDLQVLYETHQTLRMSGSDQGPMRRVSPFSSTNSLLGPAAGAAGAEPLSPGSVQKFQSLAQDLGGGDFRILVVANRLPVSIKQGGDGAFTLKPSSGGLVSALTGVESSIEQKWIGWPGMSMEDLAPAKRDELVGLLRKGGYEPVLLDQDTLDLYYNGYCNSVLWQLFHYIPLNQDLELSEKGQQEWEAYKRANRTFAEAVLREYRPGDVVWCHDYHLMLLPKMLKEASPDLRVGWFLHTPFPSSEIYRVLPERNEILEGVLEADLVGFHTYDYARHFVSACSRILGVEGTAGGVENAATGKNTRIAVFPIGIDPERFSAGLQSQEVQDRVLQLKAHFGNRVIMLGVDRLDMIKGIPQKLLAYEKFLEDHPEWREKVLLVQLAVPTRTDVPEYQKLTRIVHECVGRINGRFGSLTGVPIHHLDQSMNFHELIALYACTDVCIVSSLRDGMNLVSYEYVTCQHQKEVPGALILSEFAGAAQSLGAGAILVNPWNVNDLALGIARALQMTEEERLERHQHNFHHICVHTSQAWAENYLSELADTQIEAALRTRNIPPSLQFQAIKEAYGASQKRLLVLGYNATLSFTKASLPEVKRQFDQLKSSSTVHPESLRYLAALTRNPDNIIVILSGSTTESLAKKFKGVDLWLAAENGLYLRPPPPAGQDWEDSQGWIQMQEEVNLEWMDSVKLVFDYFSERTPRSKVDARGTSLVWSYKYADIDFGRLQARDMLQHLWTGPINNSQVDIIAGARTVEARPVGLTKGKMMEKIYGYISEFHDVDFLFCAGHFLKRDEDIFDFFDNSPESSGRAFEPPGETLADPVEAHPVEAHPISALATELAHTFNGKSLSPTEPNIPPMYPNSGPKGAAGLVQRLPGVKKEVLSSSANDSFGSGGRKQQFKLPNTFITCTVGRKMSRAEYMLPDSSAVAELLKLLSIHRSSSI